MPISTPAGVRLAGLTVAFCLGLMVAIACLRGIWFDEIWSIWASRHDIPLRDVFQQRWLKDVHPPLFHAVNWSLAPITGENIIFRRLEELVLVSFVFLYSIYISTYRNLTRFIIVFLVLFFSNRYSIIFFGEYRSYFLQIAIFSTTLISLYAIYVRNLDFERKKDILLSIVLFVSIVFSLNIHYISTLISAITLGLIFLDQLRQGHWRWSIIILCAVFAAAIPLLTFYFLELEYLKATAGDFWIETTFGVAVRTIGTVVGASALGNVVAAVAAGSLVLGLWNRASATSNDEPVAHQVPWSFVLAMGGALVIASATLLTANQIKPVIIERYLISMVPIISAMVAVVATAPLWSSRLVFMAFLANGAITAAASAFPELHNQRWYATARHIRAEIDACPTTRVYALAPDLEVPYRASPGSLEVHEWGYRLVARHFGFPVGLIRANDSGAPQLSRNCPTLFWAEHMGRLDLTKLRDASFARALPAPGLAGAAIFRDDTGFILTLPPSQAKLFNRDVEIGRSLSSTKPAAQ